MYASSSELVVRLLPRRNPRSVGLKLMQGLQMCVCVAISIWLLYQVKHFYNRKACGESSAGVPGNLLHREGIFIKLGRKHLHVGRHHGRLRKEGDETDEKVLEGIEDEEEEPEESEEVEDLIDEDDGEIEDGGENKNGGISEDLELHHEPESGGSDSRGTKDEPYMGNGATILVGHTTQTLRTELKITGIKKLPNTV